MLGLLVESPNLVDFSPLSSVGVSDNLAQEQEAAGDSVVVDAVGMDVNGAAAADSGTDWKSLFLNQSLSFFPHVKEDGRILVKPPHEVLLSGAQQWSNALIVNFGDWVLESGPWHIQQKAIVLRKLAPGLMLDVVCLGTASVWVKLWHVPFELYSQQGLEYIASALGRPLYMDRATVLKKQLEFAKVCIDIDDAAGLPSSVMFKLGEGRAMDIAVELVWSPPRCSHCVIFGHSVDKCGKLHHKGADEQHGVSNSVQKIASGIGLGTTGYGLEEPQVAVGGVGLVVAGCGLEEPWVVVSGVGLETTCCGLVEPHIVVGVSVPACSIDHVVSLISDDGVGSGFVVGVQQDVVVGVDKASPSHHVSGSPNSFGALSPEVEDVEVRDVSPRRGRVVAEGFAVLMKNLKTKVKESNKKRGRGGKQGKGKGGKEGESSIF
ncbi:hypothetical protein GQ457_10G003940 [Hibiscus cannabinus]